MAIEKPVPVPNADDRQFWEACKKHELCVQKCQACGLLRWPPSFLCPQCHGKESQWIPLAGKGKVYTYTVFHRAFHPAFEKDVPYVTAVIALDEGPHLLSNIVGCAPDQVTCDMPVEVVWEDRQGGHSIPKFRPV